MNNLIRSIKIISLNINRAIESRSRSIVWFTMSLINPLLMIIFWTAASASNNNLPMKISSLQNYYLLLIVVTSLIISHAEEGVAYEDIRHGGMAKYLLKPAHYYWLKFFEEIPFRLLQGSFGVIVLIGLTLTFKISIINLSATSAIFALVVIVLAIFICYTFKM